MARAQTAGELPGSTQTSDPTLGTPPPFAFSLDPARAAKLSELERQHGQLHVARWITLTAIGGAALITTVGLMVSGAIMAQAEPCGDDPREGCGADVVGRNLLISSAVTGAIAGGLLAVSLPRLVREAKQARALNAEIRRASQPRAWLRPTPDGVQVGLSLAL